MAASVADGRPLLAVSFDSGAHWRLPRLSTPDGEIAALRVAASVAGDVWLIGERRYTGRFPALWRRRPSTDKWPGHIATRPGPGRTIWRYSHPGEAGCRVLEAP